MTLPALPPTRPTTRRSFLGLTGAAATTAAMAELAAPAPALAAPADTIGDLRFAVVTDTHANVDIPSRTAQLRTLLTHIEARRPDLVLNCGDLTDYGVDGEFAAYRSAVPDTLWPRMRHVAGNHEWRWDISAMESYRRWFGEPTDSFDLGGLHFVGLSPYQLLEEPSVYGAELLAWLRKDLDRHTSDTEPAILFTHMPIGAPNYYVNDSEDLLDVLEKRNVRALFTGHTHTHEIMPMNGFTQVNGRASRDGIDYFWVERVVRNGAPELTVDAVRLAADGSTSTTRSAVIPLRGARIGRHLEPNVVRVDMDRDAISVQVRMPAARAAEVSAMVAQIYPQSVYGGRRAPQPVALTRTATGTFETRVAMADLTPGHQRVQVRALDAAGEFWESIVPVFIDGSTARVGWEHRVGGQVQAGIMAVDERTVVAASTTGTVTCLRVDGEHTELRWRTRIGAVHRAGAVHADTLYLPSADHHLYALDAATGAVRWRLDLGAPLLARTLVAQIDGRTDLIACAGTTTFRVTTDGTIVWRADHGNLVAGLPACDGERVYVGSGDGRAYAFDARTGARIWRVDLAANRSDAYGKMLYAPWGDTVDLAAPDQVVFSTVGATSSLDRATGALRWRHNGNRTYNPGLVLDEGLLAVEEFGGVLLYDPATGTRRWSTTAAPQRFFEAGPVRSGRELWLTGVTGELVRLDLDTRAVEHVLQITPANTFSTPVLVDAGRARVLVGGWQDGVVRGVLLP